MSFARWCLDERGYVVEVLGTTYVPGVVNVRHVDGECVSVALSELRNLPTVKCHGDSCRTRPVEVQT